MTSGHLAAAAPVAALFVDVGARGIYPRILGPDRCWGSERDARRYRGRAPVVAHPPCNLWTNLAAVNWKRYGRQRPAWYPNGSDGGCFESALENVRRFGGVLEHPAHSHAWALYGLLRPWARGWTQIGANLWVCEVWQSAYGHRACKRTWICYSGRRAPFELRWQRKRGTHQIGKFDRSLPTLQGRLASATPEAFARELIALAAWSRAR